MCENEKKKKKKGSQVKAAVQANVRMCVRTLKNVFFFSNARADSAFREPLFDEFLIRMCLILCEGDLKFFLSDKTGIIY